MGGMKGKLILAEAATGHPDGTFSVLRAGLNQVSSDTLPTSLNGALVARIETDLADQGPHQFELRCMDADGKQMIQPIQGNFDAPQGGGNTNLILGIGIPLPKAGRYEFVLRVDNVVQDSWAFTVTIVAPAKQGAEDE